MKSTKSIKGIARYLTGIEYDELLLQYLRGASSIKTRRGHALNRQDFEFISAYIGKRISA